MLKMHVQAKLNSSMTNTATEQRNYTAESLLSFRQVIYQTRNSVFADHIFNPLTPGLGLSSTSDVITFDQNSTGGKDLCNDTQI